MYRIAAATFLFSGLAAAAVPTFHKDVLPVLQKNCQECHRAGEAAPMQFTTYGEVRPWAKAIRASVLSGKMPPWFADPHVGKFANERRLTAHERDILVQWADGGAPEGDSKDAPAPREFSGGWTIGKPDMVLDMGAEYKVPAQGTIEYTFFVAPTNFTEDKWIEKIEARPGARQVVHHIVVFARPPGSKYFKDARPGEPFVDNRKNSRKRPADTGKGRLEISEFVEVAAIYVPGGVAYQTKPGQARLIKAGSDLIFQMHYTSNGKEAVDRSQVGIVFAKEPPKERVVNAYVQNENLRIPPGADNHRVDARVAVQDNVTIQAIFPHAHVRGKAYEMAVKHPDGRVEPVLRVPKYDFNWQLSYYLAEPLKLPAGTEIQTSAWYDNSPNNKFNPDPNAEVFWGDQTWEEMQIVFLDFVTPVGYDITRIVKKPKTSERSGE